jgi:hypothetical protein
MALWGMHTPSTIVTRIRLFLLALLLALPLGAAAQLGGLEPLEQSLRLNPAQKAQFDAAVGATKTALLGFGLSAMEAQARIGRELMKDRPDPAAIAALQNSLVEQNGPNIRAAHDEWSKLYALLDDRQVAIARAYVEAQLARLDSVMQGLRDTLVQKFSR